jgi:hypothetical protein
MFVFTDFHADMNILWELKFFLSNEYIEQKNPFLDCYPAFMIEQPSFKKY